MYLDYENKIKDLEAENVRMRAQYRKMEMKLDSLENDVEQKAKENAQLSALCDELINGQVAN
jgi:predicted RNase H-like nuclease (RuvC/YqgF family)